jgi:AAA domain
VNTVNQSVIDYIRDKTKASGFPPSAKAIANNCGVELSVAQAVLEQAKQTETVTPSQPETKTVMETPVASPTVKPEARTLGILQSQPQLSAPGRSAETDTEIARIAREQKDANVPMNKAIQYIETLARASNSTWLEDVPQIVQEEYEYQEPEESEPRLTQNTVLSAAAIINNPSVIASLAESGVAYNDYVSNPKLGSGYDHWLLNRCRGCGQFRTKCCGQIDSVSVFRDDNKTLTAFGRQALGYDPIKPPAPPKTPEQIAKQVQETWAKESWWPEFCGAGELKGNGTVKMYIENVIPEGICLVCGLPKEGKSFFGLACAKALTEGRPLFGRPGFEVPEIVPVLYLAAESGDNALKLRCDKFDITHDKTRFIARTLTQGPMLGLNDPDIESLVKAMRPVVILESLVRFNDGKDEDDATENRKLAALLFRLIGWGAKAVIGLHHSKKDLNKSNPTKEFAVRGSGDGLAMVDVVWLLMQDEKLYQRGSGPNEIDVVGWGRDFNPTPMRLALTKKAPKDTPAEKLFAPGIVSVIDTTGNVGWIERKLVFDIQDQDIGRMITDKPSVTIEDMVKTTNGKEWEIRKIIKRLGYHRTKGGKKGGTKWEKSDSESPDSSK